MLRTSLCLIVILLTAAVLPTSAADITDADKINADKIKDANKIKKCQDATGKWHYGDFAANECGKAKIELINKEGIKTKEIAAPPTEAELAERARHKDEIEREKQTAEEQAKRDKILLQTYAIEDDIILIRDRKLAQIETAIKGTEETLKSLRNVLARMEAQKISENEKQDSKASALTDKGITQTKGQIDRNEAVVTQKRLEQDRLRKQYAEELERYRELKLRQQTKPPVKKAATQ